MLLTADAIARYHGSQCGFCTPGMVVACHAALSKHEDKGSTHSAEQMEKALDGNLCRCTGYRPILDACKVHSPALRHLTSAAFALVHAVTTLRSRISIKEHYHCWLSFVLILALAGLRPLPFCIAALMHLDH